MSQSARVSRSVKDNDSASLISLVPLSEAGRAKADSKGMHASASPEIYSYPMPPDPGMGKGPPAGRRKNVLMPAQTQLNLDNPMEAVRVSDGYLPKINSESSPRTSNSNFPKLDLTTAGRGPMANLRSEFTQHRHSIGGGPVQGYLETKINAIESQTRGSVPRFTQEYRTSLPGNIQLQGAVPWHHSHETWLSGQIEEDNIKNNAAAASRAHLQPLVSYVVASKAMNKEPTISAGVLSSFENIIGQLLDTNDLMGQTRSVTSGRNLSRKSLLLKMPVLMEELSVDDIPAIVEDQEGRACLVVLPSDKPSTRAEALAVEGLLAEVLKNPRGAIQRASSWRSQVLVALCSDAMASLGEVMNSDRVGHKNRQAWCFRVPGPPSEPGGPSRLSVSSSNPTKIVSGRDSNRDPNLLDLIEAAKPSGTDMPTTHHSSSTSDQSHLKKEFCTDAQFAAQQALKLCHLTVVSAILMADLIRQVEVQCAERGRALAYTWNTYLSSHEERVKQLGLECVQLEDSNSQLSSQVTSLQTDIAEMQYLRKEILRFRQIAAASEKQADVFLVENLALKGQAEEAEDGLDQLGLLLTKELARLRWQHAFHILGTRKQRVLLVSGGLESGKSPSALLKKARMVLWLQKAVIRAESRKQAFGLRRKAEDYKSPVTFHEVVKSSLSASQQSKWLPSSATATTSELLNMLPGLQPEAQVLILATLSSDQRIAVLRSMTHEHRSQLVCVMSEDLIDQTRETVGQIDWSKTISVTKDTPDLAARILSVVTVPEALLEFSNWSIDHQLVTMASMDSIGGAAVSRASTLLQLLPNALRKQLFIKLDKKILSDLLEGLDAEEVRDCLSGLTEVQQAEIIQQLPADKAAAVLQCMGSEKSALILMLMDDQEISQTILSNLPPKAAAAAVLLMDELAAEVQSLKPKVQSAESEVSSGPGSEIKEGSDTANLVNEGGEQSTSEGMSMTEGMRREGEGDVSAAEGSDLVSSRAGEMLLALQRPDAENILGFFSLKDKANLLANLDASKVVEMLSLMTATEAVMLLSAIGGASMKVVSDEMSPSERDRLIKTLKVANSQSDDSKPKKTSTKKGQSKKSKAKKRISIDEATIEELSGSLEANTDALIWGSDGEEAVEDRPILGSTSGGVRLTESGSMQAIRRRASQSGQDHVVATRYDNSRVTMSKGLSLTTAQSMDNSFQKSGYYDGSGNSILESDGVARSLSRDGSLNDIQPTPPGQKLDGLPFTDEDGFRRGHQHIRDEQNPDESELEPGNHDDGDHGDASPTGRAMNQIGASVKNKSRFGPGGVKQSDVANRKGRQSMSGVPSGQSMSGASRQSMSGASRQSMSGAPTRQSMSGTTVRRSISGAAGRESMTRQHNGGLESVIKKVVKASPEGRLSQQRIQEADDAWDLAMGAATSPGGATSEPNSKLGKLPKNQRLKDAMAQHKNAKPKPKGWLMPVVEQIYKDADTIIRKLGRNEALRKQSVPEVVFGYFFNKYGQKNVVNEYVGALVNTLTLYKSQDLRLDAFARFLSEEWDFLTFLDFLSSQALLSQPTRVVAIEWPKDPEKGEQYAWVDYYKAVQVADAILGIRPTTVREKLNSFMMAVASQVEDHEVDRIRRDKRFEGEVIPDRFYRLPRINFQIILCKEVNRVSMGIGKLAEEHFHKLDIQRQGQVAVKQLSGYLTNFMSNDAGQQALADLQTQFIQCAEAQERDMPQSEVQVENVQVVRLEPFLQASTQNTFIRDYFKAYLLSPAKEEDDDDGSEKFKIMMQAMMQRHAQLLMPYLRTCLEDAGKGSQLHELVGAIAKEPGGDGKFRAYVALLVGVINIQVQALLESAHNLSLGQDLDNHNVVEQSLVVLEDMTMILLQKSNYLMIPYDTSMTLVYAKRLPSSARMSHLGKTLHLASQIRSILEMNAGLIFADIWKRRKASEASKGLNDLSEHVTVAQDAVAPMLTL